MRHGGRIYYTIQDATRVAIVHVIYIYCSTTGLQSGSMYVNNTLSASSATHDKNSGLGSASAQREIAAAAPLDAQAGGVPHAHTIAGKMRTHNCNCN